MSEENIMKPCRLCGSKPKYQDSDYVFSKNHGGMMLGHAISMCVCPKCGIETCADERDVLAYENRHLPQQIALWNKEQSKKNKDSVRLITRTLNEFLEGETKGIKFEYHKAPISTLNDCCLIKNVCRFVMMEKTTKRVETLRHEGFDVLDRDIVSEPDDVKYYIFGMGADFVTDDRFCIGEFSDRDIMISVLKTIEGTIDIFRNSECIVTVDKV